MGGSGAPGNPEGAMTQIWREEFTERALRSWAGLARQIGRAPEASHRVLSLRNEGGVQRVVLAFPTEGAVLKQTFGGFTPEALARQAQAQDEAAEALAGDANCYVPRVLWSAPEMGVLVTELAPGESASGLIESSAQSDEIDAVLRQAGVWLSCFHARFDAGEHPFNPTPVLRFIEQRMADIRAGSVMIAEPEAFVDFSQEVLRLGAALAGKPTRRTRLHGDFNLRNVLIAQGQIAAIDFTPARISPAGFDVARLLLDYGALFEPEAEGDQCVAAFFDGYRFTPASDATVQFQRRNQILADWARIPADPGQRKLLHDIRLQRLMAMAQ